jgi:hypothetical protein
MFKFRSTILAIAALCMLMPAHASGAQAVKLFSDDFTKDGVLNNQWTLSELNPASNYQLTGDGFLLETSGENGGSDLWAGTGYRASLLLRPIRSDDIYAFYLCARDRYPGSRNHPDDADEQFRSDKQIFTASS